jgi:hypothetical protein
MDSPRNGRANGERPRIVLTGASGPERPVAMALRLARPAQLDEDGKRSARRG